jgi:outer membrane protein insertion porin family
LKSSISHTFVRDRRDDSFLPTKGYHLRLTQELSGVGSLGDTKFFKNEIEASVAHQYGGGEILRDEEGNIKAVAPGYVLSLSARGGLLATLNDKEASITDRFMLGGPLSIRGFRTCGIGPRDKSRSLYTIFSIRYRLLTCCLILQRTA